MNRFAKNIGVYIIILVVVMAVTWIYQGSQGPQVQKLNSLNLLLTLQKSE